MQYTVSRIKPSPENDEIYGTIAHDLDLINLSNDIAEHGIREPIKLSEDGFIISGHRRFAAAKLAGLKTVPCEIVPIRRSEASRHVWKAELTKHNLQRNKSAAVRVKEALLNIDPDIAHAQLISEREERDSTRPVAMTLSGTKKRSAISPAKVPMLTAATKVIDGLKAFWPLSVRQVHYGLLNDPPLRNANKPESTYANDRNSYGDLTDLLARARLSGQVDFDSISDETRPRSNLNSDSDAAGFLDLQTHHFLRGYRRDLLQSKPDHVELVAEKLTVRNILEPVANKYSLPMTISRGYCSLEPRAEIASRYRASGKDRLVLLVASDFDPDGEEIAHSLCRSLRDDFGIENIYAVKVLLSHEQTKEWKLPPNGLEAKPTSSSYKKFAAQYGTNVYELEAITPRVMQRALAESIEGVLDLEAFNGEIAKERDDAARLQAIKRSVSEHLASIDLAKYL